ncbi:MAG: Arc family DNA-binding protein [Cyanosarcina radialis HA8281-LM2]|nr:Arc family DNA-binding protein [Cyanosarcina radialis HA8281-LM2]
MNAAQSSHTQVRLPTELYQAIEQRAKVHRRSVNSEIVALLAASLGTEISGDLATEFAAWETASDEDWLNIEARSLGEEL